MAHQLRTLKLQLERAMGSPRPPVESRSCPPGEAPPRRRRVEILRQAPVDPVGRAARTRSSVARHTAQSAASELRDTGDGLPERLGAAFGAAYTIERELGGGGMSRVFAAEETALGRRVAIKVLAPEISSIVDAERFRREVQVAARLQHPHIVPVLTAGEIEGMLYYTMPFIEGQSLRARLAHAMPLPIEGIVGVVRDVAKALRWAHERGVVHRDVKPENVLVHQGGDALVADFGVAKALSVSSNAVHTAAGFVLGTPAYISPEQAACDPATDHRADLYSLGVVAYELLAGVHPYAGRSPHAVIMAHMIEAPTPVVEHRPDVPRWLADLVMHLLEKCPDHRPQSAGELLHALGVHDDLPTCSAPAMQALSGRGWHQLLIAAAAHVTATLTNVTAAVSSRESLVAAADAGRGYPTLSWRLQQFLTDSRQVYARRLNRRASGGGSVG